MRFLALLLLGPWLLVLIWAYWSYPKSLRRTRGRRVYDLVAIIAAVLFAVALTGAGFDSYGGVVRDDFGRYSGGIWQQVMPVLYAYGGFLAVLAAAMAVRQRVFRIPRQG